MGKNAFVQKGNKMKLAFPTELNRFEFTDHMQFLKDCGVESVPLYFMNYGKKMELAPSVPGEQFDMMLDSVKKHTEEIRSMGMDVEVLYPDFRTNLVDVAHSGKQGVEWLKRLFSTCRELGIKDIGAFPKNPGKDEIENIIEWDQNQIDGYKTVCAIASEYDLRVCMHFNMSWKSRFDSVEAIDSYFEKVGFDNFGILFCCGCIALAGLDVPKMLMHWKDRVFIVHLRDVEGDWSKGNSEMQFGTGIIDQRATVATLRQIGYKGILHPEHFPIFNSESPVGERKLFDHAWDRGPYTTAWSLGFWKGMLCD